MDFILHYSQHQGVIHTKTIIWPNFGSYISLWLREHICTLHDLCFGLNKYIITCVEVNFFAGFGIYEKTNLVRSRYNLCSV